MTKERRKKERKKENLTKEKRKKENMTERKKERPDDWKVKFKVTEEEWWKEWKWNDIWNSFSNTVCPVLIFSIATF